MRFLFLFVDGLGLGADDPQVNPLAAAAMPALQAMLGGRRLLKGDLPVETGRATLLALDARARNQRTAAICHGTGGAADRNKYSQRTGLPLRSETQPAGG